MGSAPVIHNRLRGGSWLRPITSEYGYLVLRWSTKSLTETKGVDFQGYVRMEYVCETRTLEIGVERLNQFLNDGYEEVPVSKKVLVAL